MNSNDKMFPFKMIIFDKDGTLGNDKRSLKLWKEKMTNRILNHLLFKQIDTSDIMSEYHEAIGWDVRKNDLKPSAPLAAGTWKETIDILVKVFDNYFSEAETLIPLWQREIENNINHADDPPLIDDLGGLIDFCKEVFNLKVSICTSDVRSSTLSALQKWGIHDKIDHIVCGDDVENPKPNPEPLLLICKQAGILPHECIMVGDTTSDTGVAKNSGVGLMLAVLSGTGTAKELAENGADHLLSDVSKVPEMLMQLKQSCTGCKEIDINDESNFGEISILESCTSEAIYIQA